MDKENKKIMPNFVCKVCDLGWYSTFSKKSPVKPLSKK